MRIIPLTKEKMVRGSRFVTAAPPLGLGAAYRLQDDAILAEYTLGPTLEGPPRHAHGGVLAALLDEAMGAAAWHNGRRVVAVHLAFDYRHPVPLGQPIRIKGWVEKVEGRKVFARSTITLSDERIAVEGQGIFVEAPQFFERPGFTFDSETESAANTQHEESHNQA